MDVLTFNGIKEIASAYHGYYFHDSTIAYIQELLRPFVEAMEHATTSNQILDWLPMAFGNLVGGWLIEVVEEEVRNITNINNVKSSVVNTLIETLVEMSSRNARSFNDYTVFPWDIIDGLTYGSDTNKELGRILGIVGIRTMPVTITVGLQDFTHDLTLEFVAGLLVFSLSSNHEFNIRLLGYPVSQNWMLAGNNRFTDIRNKNLFTPAFPGSYTVPATYTVEVNNTIYAFTSTDFMRGFSTGAQWLGVNHHDYWKNLMMYDIDHPNGINITF